LGIERLLGFLRRHGQVTLDTSVFFYQLEGNAKYVRLTKEIFAWLEEPGRHGVTSTITMTELLVKPYRERDERGANDCFALFSRYPNLEWVAPNLEICNAAARIRSECGLKTPDAIEAATAIYCGIPGFLTNDFVYQRVPELDALVLEDVL
jgi:predicted nucleic acid-binding protein